MERITDVPHAPPRDTAARMRDALARAGYVGIAPFDRTGVHPILASGYNPTRGNTLALALWRTSGGDALDTLTRLFFVGLTVPAAAAAAALAGTGLGPWVEAGLLSLDGDAVRARHLLTPAGKLYLASDPGWGGVMGPLHVLGYNGTAKTLASATVRQPCDRVLDLGCGCGIQGLLAAAQAGHVVCTDINPRALAFTRFNAAFNGLENVETRAGDFFAPVAGERFDLIITNPPFVVSPETSYQYRDGGRRGDDLARELIAAAPDHLDDGGFFQMLGEWTHPAAADWRDKVTGWLADAPVDAWVVRFKTMGPAEHAGTWAHSDADEEPAAMAARLARWVDWYREGGMDRFTLGLVNLRKRAGAGGWRRFDDAPLDFIDAENHVAVAFAAEDWLTASTSDELLAARFRLSDAVRYEQRLKPAGEGWELTDANLRLTEAPGYVVALNQTVFEILTRCRGEVPLARALDQVDAELGVRVDRAATVTVVRSLIRQGFLFPVTDDEAAA